MKVLIVGGGGREHAIAWKVSQSPRVTKLYCAPGNAGIAKIATCVPIGVMEFDKMVAFAKEEGIDFVIVGPDDPLVGGIVDKFEEANIRVFGPRKNAAILEGSKAFSKDLMKKYGIPTAAYETFNSPDTALEYVKTCPIPTVLKADGLALGKGVLICNTREEAIEGVKTLMLDRQFGSAGDTIVVEEFMTGREVSVLSFTDSKTIRIMTSAQDHKRAKDAMAAEGRPFKGVIFFGLMLTPNGPKVLEFNARFGDPETQVVLPRMENDLMEVFEACVDGTLDQIELSFADNAAVCVVLASDGYPVSYQKGFEIKGLENFDGATDKFVFHAGSKFDGDKIVTNGGRVLGVTAIGPDLKTARANAQRHWQSNRRSVKH